MSTTLTIGALVAAALAGGLIGFLLARLAASRRFETLSVELERARVRLESETRGHADRAAEQEESRAHLTAVFQGLARDSLRSNSELFLKMARTTLEREQVVASGDLKARETAIAQLIEPLKSALAASDGEAKKMERERLTAFAALRTQLDALSSGQSQLQRETRNLVTALRRPEVRGRWGELTLRRLVELAGLSEHCDFTEQHHIVAEGAALRPDLVVHLPDARDLIVDVKTPLDAYLEALEADTEEARAAALRRHAQQVEVRIRQLADKNYGARLASSPGFTILFLPGDQFLSAALTERPDLLDEALRREVILATPSTLIALLKTVAYGWRQAALTHNAAIIRELGQELYRRLGHFAGHLGRMGQRLGQAVEAYNTGVGSLERQVLPQARRFIDLGVTADELGALEPITEPVRTAGVGNPSRACADGPGDEAVAGRPVTDALETPNARTR